MAALYGFAAVMLWFVPSVPARSGAGDTHVFADLAAGAGYVRSHPRLRVLVLFFISVIMVGFPYVTVMPGLVENAFGRDADAISVLFLASAVGGLGASLVAARVADTRLAQPLFVVLAALFGVGLLLLSAVPSYEAAVAVSVVAGAGMGGFQSLNGAVIVRTSEPVYFGRVFSLTMLAFAGFGLMGLPVGWMADAVGERGVLRAMGIAVVLLAAAAGVWLARVLRAER
jgi:DHA3 family macrolide efflux protein-like MFS transporter